MAIIYLAIIVFAIFFIFSWFRVLREYERAVVFTLGRFWRVKGPGLIIIVPVIQQMVRVTLRTIVMSIPSQDVISRDNVSIKVSAVLYFRVIDAERAIIQVEDFYEDIAQLRHDIARISAKWHRLKGA